MGFFGGVEMTFLYSKVVSTHTFGTHPEQPLPRGYSGIPFIVGQGDCLGCALGVCCNFLGYMGGGRHFYFNSILPKIAWNLLAMFEVLEKKGLSNMNRTCFFLEDVV